MKSIEVRAKTVEEALANGLEELGASLADVSYEVIDPGKKGLLGLIGGKQAVVRITLNEEDEPTGIFFTDEYKNSSSVKAPKVKTEKPVQPKGEKAEKPAQPKAEKPVQPKSEKAEKPAQPKAEKPVQPKGEKAEKPAQPKREKTEKPKAEKSAQPKPEKPVQPKAEKKAKSEAEETPIAVLTSEPSKASDYPEESPEYMALDFLGNLTHLMGVDVQMFLSNDEPDTIRLNLFGDSKGVLIGRRGETLDSIQYLTSLYVNRGKENYTRVTIDTENYRAKREEALRRLANRMANRAVKTGRKVVMEPMNPYERRILHSALQQNNAVSTHSEGEEPNRHVVITLKNASKGTEKK